MKIPTSKKWYFISTLWLLMACNEPATLGPTPQLPGSTTTATGVIQDEFEGESIVLYGNSEYRLMVAYSRELANGDLLDFQLADAAFPNVFADNEGGIWNIFGEAVSGPRTGEHLVSVYYQVGYWFSFAAIYPVVTLYGEATNELIDDGFVSPEWLINPDDIQQGALRDAIPSIDNPQFETLTWDEATVNRYAGNELMVVVPDNDKLKAYPLAILNWHEIVNDAVNGEQVVLSHCPLTGTSAVWGSNITGNQPLEFGVSGLLYNNNLILYDRNTDSLWPQIIRKAVFGSLKNFVPQPRVAVEMNWRGLSFLQGQPTLLLSENTGFNRDYSRYPYGDYRSTASLLFPLTYTDDRLHPKERVLAVIINDKAKVYQLEKFGN